MTHDPSVLQSVTSRKVYRSLAITLGGTLCVWALYLQKCWNEKSSVKIFDISGRRTKAFLKYVEKMLAAVGPNIFADAWDNTYRITMTEVSAELNLIATLRVCLPD